MEMERKIAGREGMKEFRKSHGHVSWRLVTAS